MTRAVEDYGFRRVAGALQRCSRGAGISCGRGPRSDDGKALQTVPAWGITSRVAPVGSSGFLLSGEMAFSSYFPLGLGLEAL